MRPYSNSFQGVNLKTLRLTDLTYGYSRITPKAIEGVSFDWHSGELIILAGPSGSGKSTLGKLIKGLIAPDAGMIELILGDKPNQQSNDDLLDLVGWADAQPERQIFAATVADEVGFALINQGVKGEELQNSVVKALLDVSLDPEQFLTRDPLTLSGGEKRRIALASTIVVPTPFLILDEPEGGLDESGFELIVSLIRKLKDSGSGIMVISHDPAEICRDADRVLTLDNGKLTGDYSTMDFDWQQLTYWLETGKSALGGRTFSPLSRIG